MTDPQHLDLNIDDAVADDADANGTVADDTDTNDVDDDDVTFQFAFLTKSQQRGYQTDVRKEKVFKIFFEKVIFWQK